MLDASDVFLNPSGIVGSTATTFLFKIFSQELYPVEKNLGLCDNNPFLEIILINDFLEDDKPKLSESISEM